MVKDPPDAEDQLPVWFDPGLSEVHRSDLRLWSETSRLTSELHCLLGDLGQIIQLLLCLSFSFD